MRLPETLVSFASLASRTSGSDHSRPLRSGMGSDEGKSPVPCTVTVTATLPPAGTFLGSTEADSEKVPTSPGR
ncbi:MAG TPA: hypothetical protein VFS43_16460 [Polyangiaceae bacterium]|nr:hypothetical protein [Polyangiaceae bacterium]